MDEDSPLLGEERASGRGWAATSRPSREDCDDDDDGLSTWAILHFDLRSDCVQ